jgi:hypothetical protein
VTTRWQFPSGRQVIRGRSFTDDYGTQYSDNWLELTTDAEKAAIGLTPAAEPVDYDGRWYNSDGTFKPLAEIKQRKLVDLAAYRYGRETAGVTGFSTDRESQSLITGAALAATLDPAYTVDWKGAEGWVTLNATQLLAAAQAVRAHVQACFSNEKAHALAIEALTDVQSLIDYDFTTGWPQ